MKKYVGMLLVVMFAMTVRGYAADNEDKPVPPGTIRGRVVDAELVVPLEYANIVLYDKNSKAQITGTITDENGVFRLNSIRPGVYTIEVSFIGYYATIIDTVQINSEQPGIDLGTISLEQAVLLVDGVEVVAEKSPIEFKIDKKVINVSRYYTAVSGTAVDVLEKVPSVTVDIEGNVSLRGSTNFNVLIDSRPTVLEPSDALQQIPASTIENIEIITNPSAKYDPDGLSGILNIITKKAKLQGVNGITNLSFGLDEKYGGDLLLNYRSRKFQVYFGADYNNRNHPGTSQVESRTSIGDTASFINSNGNSRWGRTFYGLRGGIDWYLSAHDIWSLGLRYGGRNMERSSVLDFDEWTDPGDTHQLYISESSMKREGSFYSASMDYHHAFNRKEHELSGQVSVSRRGGKEESTNELLDIDSIITRGQLATEEGPSTRLRLKLDYRLPLWGKDRFETGYQSRLERTEDIAELYDYDPDTGEYVFRPEFSHTIEYNRDIHSLYTMYAGELGRFGYQGGLRGEYTYRLIELMGEDESFTIDRWDFFPTVHVSYQYPVGHQMMASYTRRIERPRGWALEPFETWSDAYNVRRGNPAIKPEYIDSYELGYQKQFGRNLFSLETYYRVTHNKIERVRTVYDANIILHSFENVGTDYTFGTELMLDWDLFKWLNLNVMGSLYDYRIKGVLYGDPFSQESFNWTTRINSNIKIGGSTRIQINGIYNSPTASSQGRRESFFTTNAALKRDFLDRKLTATLQVRDIFSTANYEFTTEGADFFSHSEFSRKSPVVMLTLNYNFNNYKQERQRDERQEVFEDEEEF